MVSESRKLHLIEQVLKLKNDALFAQLELLLGKQGKSKTVKKSAHDFVGVWSKKDADIIANVIEGGCEQIHPDDWK